jgi:hypothetical protein
MADSLGTKVLIKQEILRGNQSQDVQRVALVYINGDEYVVSAPSGAEGKAADWLQQLIVTKLVAAGTDELVQGPVAVLALRLVKDSLATQQRDVYCKTGRHPDGVHCAAQICLTGHIQHCDGMPFESNTHCTACGKACVDACSHCNEPIRGVAMYQHKTTYAFPRFCHGCGRPYPWMDEKLRTARELLYRDDVLTVDEKNSLWDDLQYVMSDPKADLVPAKRKLIDLKLKGATELVRQTFTELIAKTLAEVFKPKS